MSVLRAIFLILSGLVPAHGPSGNTCFVLDDPILSRNGVSGNPGAVQAKHRRNRCEVQGPETRPGARKIRGLTK
jgi:hypothetical protein